MPRGSPPAEEPPSPGGAEHDGAPATSSSGDALRPSPAPREVIPPEGGFQSLEEQGSGSRLRLAIPAVLAGAIAGLIAVLAWRRTR